MRGINYSSKFYEELKSSLVSARIIVPLVIDLIEPKSVIDVGCGQGEFLSIFKKNGVNNIFGVDGRWVDKEKLYISEKNFKVVDLENPLEVDRKFDLAVCLEVAEHLPEDSAENFIKGLTNLAPVVLFSAAIPYQGGTNHVNEQWVEYWAKLFKGSGYFPVDIIRKKIWNNDQISFWYAQNMLLFVRKDYIEKNDFLKRVAEQTEFALSIVHPKLYLQKVRYENMAKKIRHPIKWIIGLGKFH